MADRLAVRLSFEKADESLAKKVAETLSVHGFEILGRSARGVDVSADRTAIEDFFKASIGAEAAPQFASEPSFDRLPVGQGYRAYFPRKPELF